MKSCKHCGKDNHQSFQCFTKQKPIRQTGKKGLTWLQARRAWFKLNPPDYKGYYYCEIVPCLLPNVPIIASEVTLDHPINRTKRPDLILDITKLVPGHGICNSNKGSKVEGEYERYEARR